MESGKSLSNGGQQAMMKLPIGFRFRPTDEELLLHYLARKALSLPLPAPVILDFDVFTSRPDSLPGTLPFLPFSIFLNKGVSFISKKANYIVNDL